MSEAIHGDAGRIGFLLKGEYIAESTYDFLDVVYYGGASYVAKKETTGNPPAENNEFWQILARGGAQGDFASKAIYGDNAISLGRKEGSAIGNKSISYGNNNEASNLHAFAVGSNNTASGDTSFSAGWKNQSLGLTSASFGNNNVSVDNYSFSEGCGNIALGYGSHVEGAQNISGAKYVLKIESYDTSAKTFTFDDTYTDFSKSFAQLTAGARLHIANVNYINDASVYTVASVGSDGKSVVVNEDIPASNFSVYLATIIKSGGNYRNTHAEGNGSVALRNLSHAEGYHTESRGYCSHTEGHSTKATNNQSHAEGYLTIASGEASHSEGYQCVASGKGSHAGGTSSTASGEDSFVHGKNASATKTGSVAFGYITHSNGINSFCEGENTTASGRLSHSEGWGTTSLKQQHVMGTYNDPSIGAPTTDDTIRGGSNSNTAFVIGNGTSDTPSNAARIDYNGKLWCKEAYSSTGADYAELFEWADGNPDNEDRRGYFVTVEGKKIKKAQAGDYILGIISGNPSVIGNTDMEWYGQFMRDEFGTFIKENYKETVKEPVIGEDGNVTEEEKEVDVEFYKVNPDYDPDAPYTFRLDRPEWDAVGMVGVLPVRDDGTCEVGRYCKCAVGGIATLAMERGFDTYMVIERVSENIVSVILK